MDRLLLPQENVLRFPGSDRRFPQPFPKVEQLPPRCSSCLGLCLLTSLLEISAYSLSISAALCACICVCVCVHARAYVHTCMCLHLSDHTGHIWIFSMLFPQAYWNSSMFPMGFMKEPLVSFKFCGQRWAQG